MRVGNAGRQGGRGRCIRRSARAQSARDRQPGDELEGALAEKLGIGATFPTLTLDLVGGGTLELPGGLDAKYRVILFYRGHW